MAVEVAEAAVEVAECEWAEAAVCRDLPCRDLPEERLRRSAALLLPRGLLGEVPAPRLVRAREVLAPAAHKLAVRGRVVRSRSRELLLV